MSTSDQHKLTRKQLRESRTTGSNPIVTPEVAEAQSVPAYAPAHPVAEAAPQPVIETEPEVDDAGHDAAEPLTRRQVREQERIRTGSLPVFDSEAPAAPAAPLTIPERPAHPFPGTAPAQAAAAPVVPAPAVPAPAVPAPADASAPDGMITDVPRPTPVSRRRSFEPSAAAPAAPSHVGEEQDGVDDADRGVAPVSASAAARAQDEVERTWQAAVAPESVEREAPAAAARAAETAAPALLSPEPDSEPTELWSALVAESDSAGRPSQAAAEAPAATEPARGSSVNPGFGERVLSEPSAAPRVDSFDALIGDSTGSHHAAPNALIFQQAPGGLSLSGPVASTGEILVTGSYELPAGLGSRGHADGVADGKEVDAVLLDGELAPASSPTPIAASAAIGTIKPAAEVIRPPEPEKGNKLMLVLTITAGALAVALVGALIVAITTGAFS